MRFGVHYQILVGPVEWFGEQVAGALSEEEVRGHFVKNFFTRADRLMLLTEDVDEGLHFVLGVVSHLGDAEAEAVTDWRIFRDCRRDGRRDCAFLCTAETSFRVRQETISAFCETNPIGR